MPKAPEIAKELNDARFEMNLPENMRQWLTSAARISGRSDAALVRHLISAHLDETFGPDWRGGQGEPAC